MVGSAICRALADAGLPAPITFTSAALDLRDQAAVRAMMEREKPTHVFLAAAKVGGIHANNIYRAEFLYDNLMIEANIIHAAHAVGVEKLLFLGSSCIYPKLAEAMTAIGPVRLGRMCRKTMRGVDRPSTRPASTHSTLRRAMT